MKQNDQKDVLAVAVVVLLLFILYPFQAQAVYPYSYGGGYQPQAPIEKDAGTILHYALAAFLGGLLGAFFSKPFAELRKALFIFSILIGAIFGATMNVIIGDIAFFILGTITAYWLINSLVKGQPGQKPTTFGSAEWATYEHLEYNKLIGKDGFFLGVYSAEGNNHPLHYTGDRHLLTVAPTRSGKGVSAIIPNLLTYRGSAVIIDPKGENAMITAKRRKEGLGQTVHVVDPWGITGLPSSRFNPLDWLDPADSDINENAMILADALITPRSGNADPFWDDEAKALLMGFLLWVSLDEGEQANRTLGRVRDIISLGEAELNDILGEMSLSSNHLVSSAGVRTLSKEEKLKSSVLAALQAHTHFLDSPRIRQNLSVSDFKFEDLKISKTTIYLVLPADRLETFGRWLRLLIQQALTVNARNIGIKPNKPILFLLDEMAALGRLTMVEQAYSLMAGFGVQLWGIVQDLSQLERIYDKGWQTFIGNSGVLQYFGSRDLKTAEYFSRLCGVTTIVKVSFAQSIARAFSSSYSSSSSSSSNSTTSSDSVTADVVQRHLAFPDELMVMRDNKELVFVESFNPIPAQKVAWFEDEALKHLGVNLHSNPPESQLTIKTVF